MGHPVLPRRSSEEKSEKIPKESVTNPCIGEKTSKTGNMTNKNNILMCLCFISCIRIFYKMYHFKGWRE